MLDFRQEGKDSDGKFRAIVFLCVGVDPADDELAKWRREVEAVKMGACESDEVDVVGIGGLTDAFRGSVDRDVE